MNDVILKAMAKDRDERFKDSAEFRKTLEAISRNPTAVKVDLGARAAAQVETLSKTGVFRKALIALGAALGMSGGEDRNRTETGVSSDGSSPRQRAEFRRQLPEFASVMGWIGRSASVYRLLVRQRNPQRIEDFRASGIGSRVTLVCSSTRYSNRHSRPNAASASGKVIACGSSSVVPNAACIRRSNSRLSFNASMLHNTCPRVRRLRTKIGRTSSKPVFSCRKSRSTRWAHVMVVHSLAAHALGGASVTTT